MQPKESKSNRHFQISLVKSLVRITAGLTLAVGDVGYAGVLLIVAEMLGIAEELQYIKNKKHVKRTTNTRRRSIKIRKNTR